MSVQWLAAFTTIIAGLMSVPAIVVSMNALDVAHQQVADARKQRAEDQKERASEKAEAEDKERSAFIKRITIEIDDSSADGSWLLYLRNTNSQPVYLALKVYQKKNSKNVSSTVHSLTLDPCTRSEFGPVHIVSFSTGFNAVFAASTVGVGGDFWRVGPKYGSGTIEELSLLDQMESYDEGQLVDLDKWLASDSLTAFEPLLPSVVEQITPCV
ncbi:hypothetical protein [Herbidospora cretacea]|uniref:hypothetical protein n=1 Tax=Herbidospora cretacea TaxID=28444 RepID=UPI0012DF5480|nr:hypothetical protein [Herbidospora cretacea]